MVGLSDHFVPCESRLSMSNQHWLPFVHFFSVSKDYVPPPKTMKVAVRKSLPRSSTDVVVSVPGDWQILVRIHRVVEKVLAVGYEFEQALIEKEAHNPFFSFLINFKVIRSPPEI